MVPEPGSSGWIAAGAGALAWVSRRKAKAAATA